MRPTEVSVLIKAKRAINVNGSWKSFGIEYGVSATLEPNETIGMAIPALDAQIRDLIGENTGFKPTKTLAFKR